MSSKSWTCCTNTITVAFGTSPDRVRPCVFVECFAGSTVESCGDGVQVAGECLLSSVPLVEGLSEETVAVLIGSTLP